MISQNAKKIAKQLQQNHESVSDIAYAKRV